MEFIEKNEKKISTKNSPLQLKSINTSRDMGILNLKDLGILLIYKYNYFTHIN